MNYLLFSTQQIRRRNLDGAWGLLAPDKAAADGLMDKPLQVHPTRKNVCHTRKR